MNEKEQSLRYSTAFKLRVVQDVENGLLNAEEARKLYGIGGRQTVHEWVRQYGMNKRIGKVVHIMTDKEELELLALRRENKMLKRALNDTQVKVVALETLIEVAEEELHIEVKKKFGAKVWQDVLAKSATSDLQEEQD